MRDRYKTYDRRYGVIKYDQNFSVREIIEKIAELLGEHFYSIDLMYNGKIFDKESDEYFISYVKNNFPNRIIIKYNYDTKENLFCNELVVVRSVGR